MLVSCTKGNFRFVPGGLSFSLGVLADPGYEVVHAILREPAPTPDALEFVSNHLHSLGRPVQALCGLELRMSERLSPAGFKEFNREYQKFIGDRGLVGNAQNPLARTNVVTGMPGEPSHIFGCSYTVQSQSERPTFVLSGVPEVRRTGSGEYEVIHPGDVSANAMRAKLVEVVSQVNSRMKLLGVAWDLATRVRVYSTRDWGELLPSVILPALGNASRRGVEWHYASPPVEDLEIEMDVIGAGREVYL